MNLIIALSIGALFAIGLYQLLRRNVIRSAIGLVILSNAINLFLMAAGAYDGVHVPYYQAGSPKSDALPQALILTAIVISMGGFSVVLALLYVLAMRRKTADANDLNHLKH